LTAFLIWLEASALGEAIRASGVWAYALINLTHILGVATLFGAVLVLDLRLLGAWGRVPLGVIATPTVPVAAAGLVVAISSGVCLLAANGSEYEGNPFLPAKFAAIAAGIANVAALRRLGAWRAREVDEPTGRDRAKLRLAGGLSLASWVAAITCGRMIGYW
jgi:hypothetical protein